MRYPTTIVVFFCLLTATTVPLAADPIVNCGVRSLADAVEHAQGTNPVITFTGVCGPVVIMKDGVTLQGVDAAVIDGGGEDAVIVSGASRVVLAGLTVQNGENGIVAVNGAHLSIFDVIVTDNDASGITLQTGSSAVLKDVTVSANRLHGLDVRAGSAATVSGTEQVNATLTAAGNRVFGINVNAGSFTLSRATVTATGNALGIQIATNGNAFINDTQSVIDANNNFATGLTVVSGAQLVSFGGTIKASRNVVGVSVNSKAGMDLDAATLLESSNNASDGLRIQQDSVMTVFNTPGNTGQMGFSTINTHHNGRHGVMVLTGSTLTLVNQARVLSDHNTMKGFVADNGAGVTLVNSVMTANALDVELTFGTRADLQTLTFGSYSCDDTVLVRGTSGITCPH
jgi:hypothetical protein